MTHEGSFYSQVPGNRRRGVWWGVWGQSQSEVEPVSRKHGREPFSWILQEGAGSTGRAGWGLAPGPGDRPSLSDTWLGDGQVD